MIKYAASVWFEPEPYPLSQRWLGNMLRVPEWIIIQRDGSGRDQPWKTWKGLLANNLSLQLSIVSRLSPRKIQVEHDDEHLIIDT